MDSNKRPETMERITTPELAAKFIDEQVAAVREQVGDKKVLLALSGGVDSSVVAALLIKAIGKQLVCVHVNHGLMRKGESESVVENLIKVDFHNNSIRQSFEEYLILHFLFLQLRVSQVCSGSLDE